MREGEQARRGRVCPRKRGQASLVKKEENKKARERERERERTKGKKKKKETKKKDGRKKARFALAARALDVCESRVRLAPVVVSVVSTGPERVPCGRGPTCRCLSASLCLAPAFARAHASLSVRPRAGRWVRLGHEALPRSHGSLRQGPSSPLHLVLCPRSCLLLERANQFLSFLLSSFDRSRVRKRVLTTVSTRPPLLLGGGGGGDLALRIRCFSIPARIFGTLGRLMGLSRV